MIIWTPIPVETKKALERGECVGQTIQESPWEVSVESVIGYEFVRDMQIKKTKIFRRQEKLFQSLVVLNIWENLHIQIMMMIFYMRKHQILNM